MTLPNTQNGLQSIAEYVAQITTCLRKKLNQQ